MTKPNLSNCPHCEGYYEDVETHVRIAHPALPRVTATVTGRKAVYMTAIDTAKRIRALTLDKLRLMDDLIESLHYQIRKEHDDDQARLHKLEQAVQRLEDAEAGRRASLSHGPAGTPSIGG